MTTPQWGVTLEIRIDLRSPESGGRSTPIRTGYRPLSVVSQPNGESITFGLGELHLDGEIAPGESGRARMSFEDGVADAVRSVLDVGSRFTLAEGLRSVGTALVLSIE